MNRLLVLLCSLALAACGPSCESQGGHWAETGNYWLMPMVVGNITILQPIPEQVCVEGKL